MTVKLYVQKSYLSVFMTKVYNKLEPNLWT